MARKAASEVASDGPAARRAQPAIAAVREQGDGIDREFHTLIAERALSGPAVQDLSGHAANERQARDVVVRPRVGYGVAACLRITVDNAEGNRGLPASVDAIEA